MPVCPPKSATDRTSERFENTAGKALKDWVTALMKQDGSTRAEARGKVLRLLKEAAYEETLTLTDEVDNLVQSISHYQNVTESYAKRLAVVHVKEATHRIQHA